jgi:ABC-2 type transport system permease protein
MIAIALVEVRRLLRSRLTLTLLLLIPAMQVALFGFAIRPGAQVIDVAIAADDPQLARSIANRLTGQPQLHLVSATGRAGSAAAAVRAGNATVGIDVPAVRSFANPFAPILPVRITVDDTSNDIAVTAIARIEALYWRGSAEREQGDANGPPIRIDRLYNPEARSDWAFMPSLVGVTVMIAMIMLGTLGIAREREGGTWETLEALPLSRFDILAGKALPGIAIGTVQGCMVLSVAIMMFGVPARGNIVALLALLPLFAAAHLVLGFVLSLRASAQIDALQGAIAFYLPAMLLSGFLYPFATLPGWAQAIGNVFPLTHFIRASRGALLHGDSALSVLSHALPIAAFLLAVSVLALLMPQRQVD